MTLPHEPSTRATPAPLEVHLLGQRLLLKPSCDAAHVQRLVDYVNQKIDEVRGRGTLSSLKLAALAALNMADDCAAMQDGQQTLRHQVARRARAALVELDALQAESTDAAQDNP